MSSKTNRDAARYRARTGQVPTSQTNPRYSGSQKSPAQAASARRAAGTRGPSKGAPRKRGG